MWLNNPVGFDKQSRGFVYLIPRDYFPKSGKNTEKAAIYWRPKGNNQNEEGDLFAYHGGKDVLHLLKQITAGSAIAILQDKVAIGLNIHHARTEKSILAYI